MISGAFEWVVTVEVETHREGDLWLAECPGLNVGSHGKTEPEAREMLKEALTGFFECCDELGTFQEAIKEPGVVSAVPVTLATLRTSPSSGYVAEWERVPISVLPSQQTNAVAA